MGSVSTDIARAKINLTLHVGRVITDRSDAFFNYHPLDSLVVFADAADHLSVQEADHLSLTCDGPFGRDLVVETDNIILRAYHAVARHTDIPPLAFTLTKNLPVSSGIGGGSADAGAALRLLRRYYDRSHHDYCDLALGLGADVPVCFLSDTARMTGIGETIRPVRGLGRVSAVLVNPGATVSTAAIFKAFDAGNPRETPRPQASSGDLLSRALDGRNDLQPVTENLLSGVGDVIAALEAQQGCQLARMSGSGATCFGLFDNDASAQRAAQIIADRHPDWWCVPTILGDTDP